MHEVLDALLYRFDRSVEHGAVALKPQLVRCTMYLQPLLCSCFVSTDLLANALRKNLSSSAGYRTESCINEALENLLVAHVVLLREVMDLDSCERFDVKLRELLSNHAQ